MTTSNIDILSTPYQTAGLPQSETHVSSEWQISSSPEFTTTIISDNSSDEDELTSYIATLPDGDYSVRVRYHSTNHISAYSDPIQLSLVNGDIVKTKSVTFTTTFHPQFAATIIYKKISGLGPDQLVFNRTISTQTVDIGAGAVYEFSSINDPDVTQSYEDNGPRYDATQQNRWLKIATSLGGFITANKYEANWSPEFNSVEELAPELSVDLSVKSLTVLAGENIHVSAIASDTANTFGTTITYQWQRKYIDSQWVNIEDQTSKIYSGLVPAYTTDNNSKVRCIITATNGSGSDTKTTDECDVNVSEFVAGAQSPYTYSNPETRTGQGGFTQRPSCTSISNGWYTRTGRPNSETNGGGNHDIRQLEVFWDGVLIQGDLNEDGYLIAGEYAYAPGTYRSPSLYGWRYDEQCGYAGPEGQGTGDFGNGFDVIRYSYVHDPNDYYYKPHEDDVNGPITAWNDFLSQRSVAPTVERSNTNTRIINATTQFENASVGDVIWFDSPDYDDVKFDRIVKTSVSTNDFIMQKYVASSSEWSVTLRFEVRAGGDNDGVTSDFNGKLVYSQDKTFYKGGMDDRARRWDLGDITWDYRVYGKPVWMIRIVAHSNNAGLPLTFTFDNDCYADISFQQLDGGQYDIDLFEPANYTPQYGVIEARPDTLEFKLELLDIKGYDHPERYNDKEVRTSWYNVSYTGPASIDPFTLGYNTSGYHKVTDISDTNAPIRLFNLDSSKKHVFRITVDGNTYFCPQGVDGGRHIDVSDKIGRYNDRYCLVKAGSTGGAWGTFGYGYDDSQGFDYYRIGLENQAHWWELQYAEGSGDADDPDNYSLQNAIRRARNAWSRTNVGSHYVDAHMKISCNNYSPFLRYYGGMQWHFRSGGGINYVDIIYDPLDQKGDANRVKWYTYKDSPLPLITVFEKEYGVGPSEVKFGDAVRENSNIDVTKAQITRGTVYKFARYEHTDGTAIDASGFNRVLQGGAILITDLRQTSVERTDGEDNTYHIGTNYGRFVDADTWVATTPW